MKYLQSYAAALFLSVFLLLSSNTQASSITAFDKNIEALHEAGVMTVSMLVHHFGSTPSVLMYSGTVEDTEWVLTLAGSYQARELILSFGGNLDISRNAGVFTVTGSFDGGIWKGGGIYTFVDIDTDTAGMTFSYGATATRIEPEIDTETPFGFSKLIDCISFDDEFDSCTDTGFYVNTVNGKRDSEFKLQQSLYLRPKNPRPEPDDPIVIEVTYQLPQDSIALKGIGDISTGNVSGSISVPEPQILSLFFAGFLGIAVVRKMHHRV